MKTLFIIIFILLGSVNIVFSCDPTNPDDPECDKEILLEKTKEDPDLILDNPALAELFSEEDFANNPEVFTNAMAMTPDLAFKFKDNGVSLFNGNRNAMAQLLAQKGDIGTYEGTQLESISNDGSITPLGPSSTTINYNDFKDSGSGVVIDVDGSVVVDGNVISNANVESFTSEAGEDGRMTINGDENTEILLTEEEVDSSLQFEIFGGGQVLTYNSIISGPSEGYIVSSSFDGTYGVQATKSGKFVTLTIDETKYDVEGKVTVLGNDHLDVEKGTKVTAFMSTAPGVSSWIKKVSIVAGDDLEFIINNPKACSNNCVDFFENSEFDYVVVRNAPVVVGIYGDKPISAVVDARKLSDGKKVLIGKVSDDDIINEFFVVENSKTYSTPNFGENFDIEKIVVGYLDETGYSTSLSVNSASEFVTEMVSANLNGEVKSTKSLPEYEFNCYKTSGSKCQLYDGSSEYEVKQCKNGQTCYQSLVDNMIYDSKGDQINIDGQYVDTEGNICETACEQSTNKAYFDVEGSPNRGFLEPVSRFNAIQLNSEYILPELKLPYKISSIKAGGIDAPVLSDGSRQYIILIKDGKRIEYDVVTVDEERFLVYGLNGDDPEYYDSSGVRRSKSGDLIENSEGNPIKSSVIGEDGIKSVSEFYASMINDELGVPLTADLFGPGDSKWSLGTEYITRASEDMFDLTYNTDNINDIRASNTIVMNFGKQSLFEPENRDYFINHVNDAYTKGLIEPGSVISFSKTPQFGGTDIVDLLGLVVGVDARGNVIIDYPGVISYKRETINTIVNDERLMPREAIIPKKES